MPFIEVEILDPKARKMLKDLEKLRLISIRKNQSGRSFPDVLEQIRSKGDKWPITLSEITKEVEAVRKRKNGKKKKESHH